MTIGADQSLMVFHADSTEAREFLKGGVADVIVADLPYGVTHGSRTTGARAVPQSAVACCETRFRSGRN